MKRVKNGAACYYDYYKTCVVEYCCDFSKQRKEAVTEERGGVTTFSSKTSGDLILQVNKVQEITAYTVDEIADFLIGLNKEEYLICKHPHLASFLPGSKEIELLDEESHADHDLLLAMKKKPNFTTVVYTENPTINKTLILLAKHAKSWLFTPAKKAEPTFCVGTVSSWRSQQEEYPTAPRRVSELEEMLASFKYYRESTEILENGQIKTIWGHKNFYPQTTVYEGAYVVGLY